MRIFQKNKYLLLFILSFLLFLGACYQIIFPRTFQGITEINSYPDSSIHIYGDNILHQNFFSKLKKSSIYFESQQEFDGNITIKLRNNGEIVTEKQYSYMDIAEDNIIRVEFPESSSNSLNYDIDISCSNCSKEKALQLKTAANFSEKNTFTITGDESRTNSGLNFFAIGEKNSYLYAFLFLGLFFGIITVVFGKKLIKFKKIGIKHFIFEFVFFILVSILFLFIFCDYRYENYLNLLLVIIWTILSLIFIAFFIKMWKSKKLKKEQLYLLLAIPIAILYAIFLIPNYVPDEPAHLWRAVSLMEEGIFNNNYEITIPNDYIYYEMGKVRNYNQLRFSFYQKPNFDKMIDFTTSASGYTIVLYPFVCLGILIGQIFSLPIMITYILARLLNVIAMLGIGYFIIKILPFGKNIAFVYLLNPMYIHQGASVSADSMSNSLCLLLIAYILYLKSLKGQISKKDYWLYFIIVILLGFCKNVYVPLILLVVLLIPKKNFKLKNNKKILLPVVISLFIACFWFYVSYFVPLTGGDSSTSNVSMIGQLKTILLNPKYTLQSLIGIFDNWLAVYVDTFFGSSMGWFQIRTNPVVLLSYRFLFITSPFIYNEGEFGYLNKIERIFSLILTFAIGFLIILSMWLCWTPVGSTDVIGVQGRYFLPIVILGLFALAEKNRTIKIKNYDKIVAVVLILVHFFVLRSIISYFI